MSCVKNLFNHAILYTLAIVLFFALPIHHTYGNDITRIFDESESRNRYIVTFKAPPLARVKRLAHNAKKHRQSPHFIKKQKDLYRSLHTQCREDLKHSRKKKNRSDRQSHHQKNFYYLMNGMTVELSHEELVEMKKLPYVDTIYPDLPVSLLLTESVPLINANTFSQSTGATGNGIVVAVIDTGVDYLHPDLGGGIGASFKVIDGYDFVNDDDDPMDDNGHGTHVSGIIAANGTLSGVAPNARILAYKVLNTVGNGISSDIISALERAADPDDNPATDDAADVINISIGGFGHPDDAVSLAVDNAVADGIVCVVAAGNESDYFSITTPGSSRDAITVGAASKTLEIAPFSSRGPTNQLFLPKPDVLAPGVSINSTIQDGKYGFKSGTSMATPHVAGTAALLLEAYPQLSPQDIKNLLRETAVSIGEDALTEGSGIIDLSNTLALSLLVSPSVVFLGIVDDNVALWQQSSSLEITNLSGAPTLAMFNWDSAISSGIDVGFPATLPLAIDETVSFPIDITVNNAQLAALTEPPYTYQGYLTVTDPQSNTYRVQIIFQKEQPDPFEPNNFFTEATPISISNQRVIIQDNGRTKIDPASGAASTPDFDWFSFTGTAGDTISLDINAQDISSSLNAKITLYDSGLNELFLNDNFHSHVDPQIRDFTLTSTGTHYIKTEGANSTLGAYHLNTHKTPDTLEWTTDITGIKQIELFENGMRTLLTYSNKIQVLDNLNAGLQLWELSAISPLKTAAAQSASTFAVLENISGSRAVSLYTGSSSTPVWKHTFSPDYSPADITVSADGSTIAVYSVDKTQQNIIIHVFNHTSNFPQLVFTQPSLNIQNNGFEISASGAIVLFSDKDKSYVLDVTAKKLRWAGASKDRALHINADATYLAGPVTSYIFRLYKWNGTTYQTEWDFNPGNNQNIFRSAISSDGDILVMGQRLQTGFSAGLEDEGLHLYFFNRSSNIPIYEHRIIKNLFDVPKDDLFGIKLPNAIDEILISPDGSEIVVSTWGADPQQAELLVFSPKYPVPLSEYFSHGSIHDTALNNNLINFISVGKHNFHFFRFGIDQQIVALDTANFNPPVPPFLQNTAVTPLFAATAQPLAISAHVTDSDGISVVTADISEQGGFLLDTIILLDNGVTPDNMAGDHIYTASWTPLDVNPHNYSIGISASDIHGAIAQADLISVTSHPTPIIVSTATIFDNDTSLHPGTKTFVEFTLKNNGGIASGTLEFTVFIQDPYIDSYTRTPLSVSALAPLQEANTPSGQFSITPTHTAPNGHQVILHTTITQSDGTKWTQQIPVSIIDTAAPYAENIVVTPSILSSGNAITITANILDGSSISTAKVHIYNADNDTVPFISLTLFDDGQHSDQFPLDTLFGTAWITDSVPRDYTVDIELTDSLLNTITLEDAASFTTKPYISQHTVLLVDDTENEPDLITQYQYDLTAIGHNFDVWASENDGDIIADILLQYTQGTVIWVIGETSGLNHLSSAEQNALITYLQSGGNLIITGQRLSYFLSIFGLQNNVLLNDYLAADFIFKDTNAVNLIGNDDNPLSSAMTFTVQNQTYTGEIDPVSSGTILLTYDTDTGPGITFSSQAAAIQHSTDTFRTFFFDFDFSGLLTTPDRQSLLQKMLDFSTAPKFSDISATPPVLLPESTVTLSTIVSDSDGLLSVSATISDSSEISIATVTLRDDGTNGDAMPNDSRYTALWQTPLTANDFSAVFTATDNANNTAHSISPAFFTTNSEPFIVLQNVIPFSTDHFAPAELVFFDISVQNSGTLTSTTLTTELLVSDPYVEFSGVINSPIPTLAPAETEASQNGSFYLKLSPFTPHNHAITLTAVFTDTNDKEYTDSINIAVDDTTAPIITAFNLSDRQILPGSTIGFTASVLEGEPIEEFSLIIRDELHKTVATLSMFDDGQHADSLPSDLFFASAFTTPSDPHTFSVEAIVCDNRGNETIISPVEMFSTIQFLPRNPILLIDDTDSFSDGLLWFTDYFIEAKLPFDLWKTAIRGTIPISILNAYTDGAIVWYTGSSTPQSLSAAEIENIQQYLDTGGNILFTGEKNAFHINGIYGSAFLNNYFYVEHIHADISLDSLAGVAADPISDGIALSLLSHAISGELALLPPANPLFFYDQTAGSGNILDAGIAGSRIDTGVFKAVFLDFPWDAITSDPIRKQLLNNILVWFGLNQTPYLAKISIEPSISLQNQTILITAELLNETEVDTVFAHIQAPDNAIAAQILLFDDGTHGDTTPNDGLFSRSYLTLPDPKNYYIDLAFTLNNQSELTYDNVYFFTTDSEPNLKFAGFDLENNASLQPGDITSIALKIKNNGHTSATAVQCTVELRDEFVLFYQTSPVQFGTIPAGIESVDTAFSFFVSLDPLTPHNHSFNGHLFITDGSGHITVERIFFTANDIQGPAIEGITVAPQQPAPGNSVSISTSLIDGSGVTSASARFLDFNGTQIAEITLEQENDSTTYSGSWIVDATPRDYMVQIAAKDTLDNEITSNTGTWFTSIIFNKQNPLLLVIPQSASPNDHAYHTHLQLLGIGHDIWDEGLRGALTQQIAALYTGETMIAARNDAGATVSSALQSILVNHLDNDGSLLLSGASLVSALTVNGTQPNVLLDSYFHTDYLSQKINVPNVEGITAQLFENDTFVLSGNLAGEISVSSPADPILRIDPLINPTQVVQDGYIAAAVSEADNGYHALLYNFQFDSIEFDEKRTLFLSKSVDFLTQKEPVILLTGLSVNPLLSSPGNTFDFQANISDHSTVSTASLYIKDSTGASIDTLQLHDDGMHNDGSSNDGTYGVQWISSVTPGFFTADITITQLNGTHYSFPAVVTFSTQSIPWIAFDYVTITSSSQFNTSGTNFFDLYLTNTGAASANDVKVSVSTTNPFVTFLSGAAFSYGTMLPAAVKKQNGAKYSLSVNSLTPDATPITLFLNIAENGSLTFSDQFTVTITDTAPPDASNFIMLPTAPLPNNTVDISVNIQDGAGIQDAEARLTNFSGTVEIIAQLFDDGLHNDASANDSLFGASLTIPVLPDDFKLTVFVQDTLNNSATADEIIYFSTKPFLTKNKILLVDQHVQNPLIQTAFEKSIQHTGHGFDVWKESLHGTITLPILERYNDGIVIWDSHTPQQSSLDTAAQQNLQSYLSQNGFLVLSGTNIAAQLSDSGRMSNELLDSFLKVQFIDDTSAVLASQGIENDPIGNGLNIAFLSPSAGEIDPLDTAVSFLQLEPDPSILSSGTIAARVSNGYKTVLLNFSLDAVAFSTQADTLVSAVLNWFNRDTGPRLISCNASPSAATILEPVTITAELDDPSGISIVTVEIFDNSGSIAAALELFDDASHGDAVSNDSIFTNSYIPQTTNTQYSINISTENTAETASYFVDCAEFFTVAKPILEFVSYTLKDTTHIPPGTTTFFGISIKNSGTIAAHNVLASLSISDPFLDTVSIIPVSFGSINPQATAASALNNFRIKPTYFTPDGYEFIAAITLSDNNGIISADTFSLITEDTTPPLLRKISFSNNFVYPGNQIRIETTLEEGSGIALVNAVISSADDAYEVTLALYDDGSHSDDTKDDGIFTALFTTPYTSYNFSIEIFVQDSIGNTTSYPCDAKLTTVEFIPQNRVLLWDDDGGIINSESAYISMLNAAGISFDYWNTTLRSDPDQSILNKYLDGCIVLFTGFNDSVDRISSSDQTGLISFLDQGGSLILSGSNNSYLLTNFGSTSNILLNTYLHGQFQQFSSNLTEVSGITGEPITESFTAQLSGGNAGETDPIIPGTTLLHYTGGSIPFVQSTGTAAIKADNGIYKTIFFDFQLENITNTASRNTLFEKSILWCLGPHITNPAVSASWIAPGNSIDIFCSVSDSVPISIVLAEVESPDESIVISIELKDDGIGNDLISGDNIFSGSYTTDSLPKDYLVDFYAENTLDNFSRLNNGISFSTQSVPYLSMQSLDLESGTNFLSAAKNNFDITVHNSGNTAGQSTTVTLATTDPFIVSYESAPSLYGTVAPFSTVHKTPAAFFLETSAFTPHNRNVEITISLTASANLISCSYNNSFSISIIDNDAPAIIQNEFFPLNPTPNSLLEVRCAIAEGTGIGTITAHIKTTDGTPVESLTLFDDGIHADNDSDDYIFGTTWITPATPDTYVIDIETVDSLFNSKFSANELFFTTIPFIASAEILLINADLDNDQSINMMIESLDNNGIPFDLWDMKFRQQFTESLLASYQYGAIIIHCGKNGIFNLKNNDYSAIQTYLANAGNLFLDGDLISITAENSIEAHYFLNQTLFAFSVQHHTGATVLQAALSNPIGVPSIVSLMDNDANGEVDVLPPAFPLLTYDTLAGAGQTISSGNAAFYVDTVNARSIILDFRFENIASTLIRHDLMRTSVRWLIDHDNDGTTDPWEISFFGSIEAFSGVDDPDNDGLTNADEQLFGSNPQLPDTDLDGSTDLAEKIAGTDPLNPQSVFAITAIQADNDGVILTWSSIAGKTYSVYYSDVFSQSLMEYTMIDSVQATAIETSYQDTGTLPQRPTPTSLDSGWYVVVVDDS